MDEYEIIMTPDAVEDLWELRNYIADVLLSPETALEYIRAVRKEIASLAQFPARFKPMDDEPWHSRGVRRLLAKNFYVYYWIDEPRKCVSVMNVIYSRRDQLRALSQRNTTGEQ